MKRTTENFLIEQWRWILIKNKKIMKGISIERIVVINQEWFLTNNVRDEYRDRPSRFDPTLNYVERHKSFSSVINPDRATIIVNLSLLLYKFCTRPLMSTLVLMFIKVHLISIEHQKNLFEADKEKMTTKEIFHRS